MDRPAWRGFLMPTLADQLAVLLQSQQPYSYCYPCLAPRLGATERNVRDTAQILVLRVRSVFGIERRVCRACRSVSETIVYKKPGAHNHAH
jgi:hypothetical protein